MKPDTVKRPPDYAAMNALLRLLMSMRSITGTYNITQGTILTGFTGTPDALGMDNTLDAPGWGFIFGSQDPEIRFRAAENGWLTKATNLTSPFVQTDTRDLGLRTALELTQDFKIQLDVKKSTTSSFQEIFRYDESIDDYAVSVQAERAAIASPLSQSALPLRTMRACHQRYSNNLKRTLLQSSKDSRTLPATVTKANHKMF